MKSEEGCLAQNFKTYQQLKGDRARHKKGGGGTKEEGGETRKPGGESELNYIKCCQGQAGCGLGMATGFSHMEKIDVDKEQGVDKEGEKQWQQV